MTDSGKDMPGPDAAGHRESAEYREILETLLAATHGDDEARFFALLDDLTETRQQSLFQDVGRLTRQLHDALTSFQVDSRVADFASDEFPDARHRLDQVISITEQSAHRTMDLVEEMLPRTDAVIGRAQSLGEALDTGAAPSAAKLAAEARDLGEEAAAIRAGLSEIIISQNYQDLAGQEIRKVILLVTEVEETLINMIRIAGKGDMLTERKRAGESAILPEGEQRITSQDEADELLSSLGF